MLEAPAAGLDSFGLSRSRHPIEIFWRVSFEPTFGRFSVTSRHFDPHYHQRSTQNRPRARRSAGECSLRGGRVCGCDRSPESRNDIAGCVFLLLLIPLYEQLRKKIDSFEKDALSASVPHSGAHSQVVGLIASASEFAHKRVPTYIRAPSCLSKARSGVLCAKEWMDP